MKKETIGTVIDVRSYGEFVGGHVAGSINIPVNEIIGKIDEIREMKTPIVLCCASGGRSAMATQMLQEAGIECKNGGPWTSVQLV